LAPQVKINVRARIKWLPASNRRPNISSIRAHDVSSFLQFSGAVVRSGALKVIEATRVFRCGNAQCGQPILIHAQVNEAGSIVQRPQGGRLAGPAC
jgi:DNA replicative helicase MCM subunit Mcm2 (Cdc46/Mcm family)